MQHTTARTKGRRTRTVNRTGELIRNCNGWALQQRTMPQARDCMRWQRRWRKPTAIRMRTRTTKTETDGHQEMAATRVWQCTVDQLRAAVHRQHGRAGGTAVRTSAWGGRWGGLNVRGRGYSRGGASGQGRSGGSGRARPFFNGGVAK